MMQGIQDTEGVGRFTQEGPPESVRQEIERTVFIDYDRAKSKNHKI